MVGPEKGKQETSEANTFLDELSGKAPMADVLVDTFRELTNPNSWAIGYHPSIKFISGNIETSHGNHSMALHDYGEQVILTIHGRAPFDDKNDWWGDVSIDVGIHKTGIWAYGLGDQRTFRTEIWFTRRFSLPASYPKWLLLTVYKIAMRLSEHYDPLHEQPTFWENGGRK